MTPVDGRTPRPHRDPALRRALGSYSLTVPTACVTNWRVGPRSSRHADCPIRPIRCFLPLRHGQPQLAELRRRTSEPCLELVWHGLGAATPCTGWLRGVGDRSNPGYEPVAQRDPARILLSPNGWTDQDRRQGGDRGWSGWWGSMSARRSWTRAAWPVGGGSPSPTTLKASPSWPCGSSRAAW